MPRTGFAFTGAQSDADVIAAVTGKTFKILRLYFTTSAASTVSFSDGADAAATRIFHGTFAAGSVGVPVILTAVGHGGGMYPVATLTKGTALKVTTSAGNLAGFVEYTST